MSSSSSPESIGRLVAARPLRDLARQTAETRAVTASGLWGSSVALVTGAIERELRRPILVICGHVDEVDDLADDMELFHAAGPKRCRRWNWVDRWDGRVKNRYRIGFS